MPAPGETPATSEMPATSDEPASSDAPTASGAPVQAPESGTEVEQDSITYEVTESGSVAIISVDDSQIQKKLIIPDTVIVDGQKVFG